MKPRAARGLAALAGLGPARVALALGASVGLHWGAWHALGDGPERAVAGGGSGSAMVVVALSGMPEGVGPRGAAAGPAAGASARADAVPRADAASVGSATSLAAARERFAGRADRRDAAGASPAPAAPRPDTAVGDAPPAQAPPRDGPDFLEAWEVDHPPEFLVAPDGLDALPALAGKAIELRVALRVDATGRRVGLEVDAEGLDAQAVARLALGVEEAFEDVAFMPARRDGRPVPSVMRWTVALDPRAPIALGFRLQN